MSTALYALSGCPSCLFCEKVGLPFSQRCPSLLTICSYGQVAGQLVCKRPVLCGGEGVIHPHPHLVLIQSSSCLASTPFLGSTTAASRTTQHLSIPPDLGYTDFGQNMSFLKKGHPRNKFWFLRLPSMYRKMAAEQPPYYRWSFLYRPPGNGGTNDKP